MNYCRAIELRREIDRRIRKQVRYTDARASTVQTLNGTERVAELPQIITASRAQRVNVVNYDSAEYF